MSEELFNQDLKAIVRGIPVDKWEVDQLEQKLGAKLFDESIYHNERERIACANIIRVLDRSIAKFRQQRREPKWIPEYLDITDPQYYYIPVQFEFDLPPTGKFPAGLIGWFRRRKYFSVKL